jgi:uncharacterized membrane protein
MNNDKLLACLAYPFPVIALVVLGSKEMRARDSLKFHAIQALAVCLLLAAVHLALGMATYGLGCACSAVIGLLVPWWPAYQLYTLGAYEVPFVADFIYRRQWVSRGGVIS